MSARSMGSSTPLSRPGGVADVAVGPEYLPMAAPEPASGAGGEALSRGMMCASTRCWLAMSGRTRP